MNSFLYIKQDDLRLFETIDVCSKTNQKQQHEQNELLIKISHLDNIEDRTLGCYSNRQLHLTIKWFYLLFQELSHSKTFRNGFIKKWSMKAKFHIINNFKLENKAIELKREDEPIDVDLNIESSQDPKHVIQSPDCIDLILPVLNIIVYHCDSIPIDKRWCRMLNISVLERIHLEESMSWLSTLGGACSALGDTNNFWADKAALISQKQMNIAWTVGDPALIARCKLYAAIALIQKNNYKAAGRIVRQVYSNQGDLPLEQRDVRLLKMCHGIWEKLRYTKHASTQAISLIDQASPS